MATPKQVSDFKALRWQYPRAPAAWETPDALAYHSVLLASIHIDRITTYAEHSWRWKVGSKQSVVAEHAYQMCLEHGWAEFSRSEFSALEDRLAPFLQPDAGCPGLTFCWIPPHALPAAVSPTDLVPMSRREAASALRRIMALVQKDVTARLQTDEPDSQGPPNTNDLTKGHGHAC